MSCIHTVAILGDKSITSEHFDNTALDWVRAVKKYNEETLRYAVSPPTQMITCTFCPKCGARLDKEARELQIQSFFAEEGDGTDTYNAIQKEKSR